MFNSPSSQFITGKDLDHIEKCILTKRDVFANAARFREEYNASFNESTILNRQLKELTTKARNAEDRFREADRIKKFWVAKLEEMSREETKRKFAIYFSHQTVGIGCRHFEYKQALGYIKLLRTALARSK